MPKEQPGLNERTQSAASSKNAKDRSNSTTLLAMRNSKDAGDAGGRGSRCSSEKDSGFSDGSDWQQTDVEDQRQDKNHCRGSECAELSPPDQHQENSGNPSLMPAGSELSTIYIIKNMVLKQQPDTSQKRNHHPRRSGSRETGSPGAAHMMLLQQPSLLLATLQLHKPSSRKTSATEKKTNGTYLPILNSYPRIAPHPSKKPPDKSPPRDESHNLSKRVCTEHKSDGSPALRSLLEQHLSKQVETSGPPCSSSSTSSSRVYLPSSTSPSLGSSSVSSMCTNSSFASTRALHRSSCVSTRHRRFLNTVHVLRQSGLLDITLRTKELLRQSNATERDIAQLRQHTELLCQAASDPGGSLNGLAAFEQLHRAMVQSGCYPNIGAPQNLPEPESAATGLGSETGPPLTSAPEQNCPVPQRPHSGRSSELQAACKHSEKVTFMPPDSSTG